MAGVLALSIAVLGVSIPVIVLAGRHLIQPLTQVLTQLAERPSGPESQQVAELHARIERMERILAQVVEEQQFQRALQEGDLEQPRSPASASLPRA